MNANEVYEDCGVFYPDNRSFCFPLMSESLIFSIYSSIEFYRHRSLVQLIIEAIVVAISFSSPSSAWNRPDWSRCPRRLFASWPWLLHPLGNDILNDRKLHIPSPSQASDLTFRRKTPTKLFDWIKGDSENISIIKNAQWNTLGIL